MKRCVQRVLLFAAFLLVVPGCSGITDGISKEENSALQESSKFKKGNSTVVPGQQNSDGSIPVGTVTGKYKSVYSFDNSGNYYWDLGDGRIYSTVGSPAELDQSTYSVCNYEVVYRGDFMGDPFMDTGWIRNNISCSGYAYQNTQTYNYLIIHETDHRYSEALTPIWGTWAFLVYAQGGTGNIANPKHPVNN